MLLLSLVSMLLLLSDAAAVSQSPRDPGTSVGVWKRLDVELASLLGVHE